MNKSFLWVLCTSVAVVTSLANQPIRRPGKADMAGTWVGYENGSTAFYRLELKNNNEGRLISFLSGYSNSSAETYKVDRWNLTNGILALKVRSTKQSGLDVTCTITSYNYMRIAMIFAGTNVSEFKTNTWECPILLFNETRFSKDIAESAEIARKGSELNSTGQTVPKK